MVVSSISEYDNDDNDKKKDDDDNISLEFLIS